MRSAVRRAARPPAPPRGTGVPPPDDPRDYGRVEGTTARTRPMADVFISYSRKDSRFVGDVADGLRARGKDVWVDIEGIRDAELFPVALREAIGASDGFVFVISPASVNSKYCMREVDDAVDAGKRICPIDFERVADAAAPEPIRVRNWIPADGEFDT